MLKCYSLCLGLIRYIIKLISHVSFFFNVAGRNCTTTYVACIGGLHCIWVGQLCLSLSRAGLKPLVSRVLAQSSHPCSRRGAMAAEGSGFPEVSAVAGQSCPTTQDTLDHGEMLTVCLALSIFWLLGELDPGSYDKCVFAALLNEVCGVW